jgi:putative radical SAM enzyme (TIGR03279 family)
MLKRKKKSPGHKVINVLPASIGAELGIEPGDFVLSISGEAIEDIFDYQYLVQEENLTLLIEKPDGEEWEYDIEKDAEEDLGLTFENGLMDEYRSCRNKCIFCFIDQMPPGMRETLYFKDDDSRLSFLQGNYVTLTNMSDHDVDRIIRFRLSPINISFHTMNPQLRCEMLHNRFAGEALKKVDRLWESGIEMNGQIVLCKGINDGRELDHSINELVRYLPHLQSVSVVPVGLTKYREGLYPLEPFQKEDAKEVLALIHRWQDKIYQEHGTHFIHAGDEWYMLAEKELPEADTYDGYLQLENGVGMMRLFLDEFQDALSKEIAHITIPGNNEHVLRDAVLSISEKLRCTTLTNDCDNDHGNQRAVLRSATCDTYPNKSVQIYKQYKYSLATGRLAYPYIQHMADQLMASFPGLELLVYPITNHFFGEQITVSGLLTGQDILSSLTGQDLGSKLLLPENMLRRGEDYFLDDMRVSDLEKALQVPIDIVKSSGTEFLAACLR